MDLNKPEFQSTLIPPKPVPTSLKLICAALVTAAIAYGILHERSKPDPVKYADISAVIDSFSEPLHRPMFSPRAHKVQAEATALALYPTVTDFYYVEGNGVGVSIDGEALLRLILQEDYSYELVQLPDGKATR